MKALIKILQVRKHANTQDADTPKVPDDANATAEHGSEKGVEEEDEFVKNKVTALIALQDWVEQIDWAADLHTMGGLKTVLELCQCVDGPIRVHALEVLATVVQNHPKTQEWAMEMGALE